MNILVAEDDTTTRLVLESLLTEWGYKVQSVENGDDAWEVLQGPNYPQIAILDWQIPGYNGVEICQRLQRLSRDIPTYAFLLTGRDSKGDIVLGLSAGANDYITKPFNDEELQARIQVAERVIEIQKSLHNKVQELKEAFAHIKTLQGILPICMHCHKIRNDNEAWERLESYIAEHSEAQFSHSVCPQCLQEHYPEYDPSQANS